MGKVFVSYRREDTQAIAGRIFDGLEARFGTDKVFFDIDSVPPGSDFRAHVKEILSDCAVVLVVIGRHWLGGSGEGPGRLGDPDDLVRVEIETALEKNIVVIPVLIDQTAMPGEASLPRTLAALAHRNAVRIDSGIDFRVHLGRLVSGILRVIAPEDGAAPAPRQAPPAPPTASVPVIASTPTNSVALFRPDAAGRDFLRSSLLALASPCLSIAAQVRLTSSLADVPAFKDSVLALIWAFEEQAAVRLLPREHVAVACRLLGTLVDEAVLARHWAGLEEWSRRPLGQVVAERLRHASDLLVRTLELARDPEVGSEFREFLCVLMGAGFGGDVAPGSRDSASIAAMREALLSWQRSDGVETPAVPDATSAAPGRRRVITVWVTASLCVAAVAGVYLVALARLEPRSDVVYTRIQGLRLAPGDGTADERR
jgi:type IV/VI secretion system ImpK/VasF family protein